MSTLQKLGRDISSTRRSIVSNAHRSPKLEWNPPIPTDKAFVQRTKALIKEADRAARALMLEETPYQAILKEFKQLCRRYANMHLRRVHNPRLSPDARRTRAVLRYKRSLTKRSVQQAYEILLAAKPEPQQILGTCSTCGVDWDDRTPGCQNCEQRHLQRSKKKVRPPRACTGCRGPLDELNPECWNCRTRHYQRARAAAAL